MITCFFYLFVGVFLLVVQTSLFPNLMANYHLFNLMTPFVIYTGLFRPLFEGIPAALFLGALMDAVTGGPFGMYMVLYFWLVIGERWGRQFLHAGSIILLPMMSAAGVLLENATIIGLGGLAGEEGFILSENLRPIIIQAVWALFGGPPLMLLLQYLQSGLDSRQQDRLRATQDKT